MSALEVKDKVQRILSAELGRVEIDRDGDFNVRVGSAVVFVKVEAVNDTTTMIACYAIALSDVTLTPELYRWVATEGQAFRFGRFLVAEGPNGVGRVVVSHTLLGDFLDAEELKWAVFALASTADDLDDKLKTQFGGRRFIED